MTSPWTVVCSIRAEPAAPASEQAGLLSMYLFDVGALAISESATDEMLELVAGFEDEASALRAAELVAAKLPATNCAVVEDPRYLDWVASQQEALVATTIGSWHIRAPWHEPPAPTPAVHEVVIDPGAAFGHGGHSSTRLCLELLTTLLERDDARAERRRYDSVVDLGTGTGVLAIVAAKTGRTVRAIESDADAITVARSNIDHNAVDDKIELTHGDASTSTIDSTDLVVANVTIDVHRQICNAYQTADRIIIAGILCSQVIASTELLPNHQAITVKTAGQWAAIDFESTALRNGKNGR